MIRSLELALAVANVSKVKLQSTARSLEFGTKVLRIMHYTND